MPVADGATDGRDRIYRIPVGFAGSPKILKQIKLKNKWILNNKKNKKNRKQEKDFGEKTNTEEMEKIKYAEKKVC